jgi:hypothetical protein
MRLLKFAGALALALISAVPVYAASPICGDLNRAIKARTTHDPGGDLDEYLAFVRHSSQRHPVRFEIRGGCYSACAVKLGAKDVRISSNLTIGIHEARRVKCAGGSYDAGIRDEEGTALYRASIPACARRIFDSRRAFDSNKITSFTGREVLDACPQIKALRND